MRTASREETILLHWPEVAILARRYASRVPKRMGVEDLVGYGSVGLINAVDTFDPSRGVQQKTWNRRCILSAMSNGVRTICGFHGRRCGDDFQFQPHQTLSFAPIDRREKDPADAAASKDWVDSLIAGLPEWLRESARLCFAEQLTESEAGRVMGMTRNGIVAQIATSSPLIREALRSRGVQLPTADAKAPPFWSINRKHVYKSGIHPLAKPVMSDRGEPFPSMSLAAKSLGFSRNSMNSAMRLGCRLGGRHWRNITVVEYEAAIASMEAA